MYNCNPRFIQVKRAVAITLISLVSMLTGFLWFLNHTNFSDVPTWFFIVFSASMCLYILNMHAQAIKFFAQYPHAIPMHHFWDQVVLRVSGLFMLFAVLVCSYNVFLAYKKGDCSDFEAVVYILILAIGYVFAWKNFNQYSIDA